jgi:probable rRNA maturation factor
MRAAPAARGAPRRRRPARVARPPATDIVIESKLWKAQPGVKAILQRAVAEAAAAARTSGGELAIVLTDDSAIRTLNRDWRGKDQPTNVLSFPAPAASSPAGKDAWSLPGAPERLLGDIVIAYETVAREAEAAERPFRHHLAHLAVHGFLHLLGHDHIAEEEAQTMEAMEIAVLARLKVPNPYQSPPLRRSAPRAGKGA